MVERDVLQRMANMSVCFNGLLVPATALETTLARFVDNLIIWNDDPIHKISLAGSAIPIRFLDRYFLVCSHHQLRNQQLENVSLIDRDGQRLFSSSGVRHYNDDNHPHYQDLAAFEFTEPCEAHPDLKERFFDLRNIPPDAPATDIVVVLVAGFPFPDQKYELEEKNHLGSIKRIVLCGPDPSSRDPALLCLRAKRPLGFDPDGMSGGSAFVVQRVRNEFYAFFAGMVVTAGNDLFHIIKAGVVAGFLAALVRQRSASPPS